MTTSSLHTGVPGRKRASEEILSRVKISQVYRSLTGAEPRRTGLDTWRAPAVWRGGDGLNVSGNDSRGVWHDFTTDEGGGILDLIVKVRGGTRVDALRWVADFACVPLDDRQLSAAERARWAHERRLLARELPKARYWRRAAIGMSEALLTFLKMALFDPAAGGVQVGEIYDTEQLLSRLRRMDGAELAEEYHWWAHRHPRLTAGMIQASQARELAERRSLYAYLTMTTAETDA